MNVPEHRFGMAQSYTPATINGLLSVVEAEPDPPRTHFPFARRALWRLADCAADCKRYRLSCRLHDLGWWLP